MSGRTKRCEALVVGPPVIYDSLCEAYPHWRMGTQFLHFKQVWDALTSGSLEDRLDILFVVDYEFGTTDMQNDYFAQSVSLMSERCLVIILDYTDRENEIRARVTEESWTRNKRTPVFFFVKPADAFNSINMIVEKYFTGKFTPKEKCTFPVSVERNAIHCISGTDGMFPNRCAWHHPGALPIHRRRHREQ